MVAFAKARDQRLYLRIWERQMLTGRIDGRGRAPGVWRDGGVGGVALRGEAGGVGEGRVAAERIVIAISVRDSKRRRRAPYMEMSYDGVLAGLSPVTASLRHAS